MSPRHVLFVDDEPAILEGLRHRLRRQPWASSFVTSGADALAFLSAHRVDVVVTDMRMPGMDGATLLEHVRTRHPDVVRIVLSGHAELQASTRAIQVAHQFLTKPCDPLVLENVVNRTCHLQDLLADEALRRVVGQITHLPAMPKTYVRIQAVMADAVAGAKDVAAIIRQDPALCAKLLQLVNSAFFRLSRTISNVEEAAAYLGLETVKRVVLAVEAFSDPLLKSIDPRWLHDAQRHALVVGSLAAALMPPGRLRDEAFVAGVLHDVGKLILALHDPAAFSAARAGAASPGVSAGDAERDEVGISHAHVGAYLLGLWGLPTAVVEAVAHHHTPAVVVGGDFGVLAAVHIANALAHALVADAPAEPDTAYLASVGAQDEWDGWLERFAPDVAHWSALATD